MRFDRLPKDWRLATLEEIASKDGYGLVDGPFGSNLPASDYVQFGVPVIRGSNLTMGSSRFNDAEFVYVSEKTAERLKRSLCGPGDIIFTKKGTLGQTGFVPFGHKFAKYLVSSNQMKLSVDLSEADPLYVYYYVSSKASQDKILRDSEATGVPKTNLEYLRTFPIPLPPLPEQRAIAHILGSLDDKIELNRQMNETLEAMARAIFKSWFVDFDPVRAKANGDPYPLDAKTMALFPDRFVDSALGEVPEGWGVRRLGEVVEFAYGKGLKADIRRSGSIPVFGSNGQIGWHDESLVRGPGIIVGRKGTPGTVIWSQADFFPIDTTFYVALKAEVGSLPYLYFSLSDQNLAQLSADSAVPGLNRNLAHMSDVLVPSANLLQLFDSHIEPVFTRIYMNNEESRTLAELRDALLPKLISGELRVPEIAATMEAFTP